MRLIMWVFTVVWLAWGWPAQARTPQASESTFTVGADIDAQGRITALQPDSTVKPPIAAVLDASARNWRFVPVLRDGKPVPVHSFIRVTVEAVPSGKDKYTIRVTCIDAGPLVKPPRNELLPDYPPLVLGELDSKGILFAIHLALAADGRVNVTGIKSYAADLSVSSQNMMISAFKRWYERSTAVPEMVAGHAVAASEALQVHLQVVAQSIMRTSFSASDAMSFANRDAGLPPHDDLDSAQKAFLQASGITSEDGPFSASVLKPVALATVVFAQ